MTLAGDADRRPRISPWAFVLAVLDAERSAGHFCDVLGFRLFRKQSTDWRMVERDGVRIMLGRFLGAIAPADLGDHNWFAYLHVDDIDALHGGFATRGAIVRQAPTVRSHGMRDMLIATPDGHRLMSGQDIARTAREKASPHN